MSRVNSLDMISFLILHPIFRKLGELNTNGIDSPCLATRVKEAIQGR